MCPMVGSMPTDPEGIPGQAGEAFYNCFMFTDKGVVHTVLF